MSLSKVSNHHASAQTVPFLISPYYGTKTLTAYFDHRYPTYSKPPNNTYPNMVIYTGADTSCSPYCYNGHTETDFDLNYEPVLAVAGGRVTVVDWWDTEYRSGINSGLGLYIEIDHGNGYRTHYAYLSAIADKASLSF